MPAPHSKMFSPGLGQPHIAKLMLKSTVLGYFYTRILSQGSKENKSARLAEHPKSGTEGGALNFRRIIHIFVKIG